MERDPRQVGMRWSERLRAAALILFAAAAGCVIAAIDTQPNWDDTGVTAGALFLVSAVTSGLGVPWWLAPVVVAGPLLIAEFGGIGWAAVLISAISLAGAGLGAAIRQTVRPRGR